MTQEAKWSAMIACVRQEQQKQTDSESYCRYALLIALMELRLKGELK